MKNIQINYVTSGFLSLSLDDQVEVYSLMKEKLEKLPDEDLEGNNDKDFASINYKNQKYFACRNETNSLTLMRAEDY